MVFLLLLFVGSMLIIFSLVSRASIKETYKSCTEGTTGLVVDVETVRSRNKESSVLTRRVVVSYTAHGKEYAGTSKFGFSVAKHAVGDDVLMYYNPTNPAEFYIATGNTTVVSCMIFMFMGITVLALDVLYMVYHIKGLI